MNVCGSTQSPCSFEGAGRGSEESGECATRKQRAERTGSGKAPLRKVSGDDSWRAPPVPIPNTEVKPPNADGTELGTAWESRKLPGSTREREERKFFPLPNIRKNGAGAEAERCAKPRHEPRRSASQKRCAKPGREPRPSVKAPEADSRPPGSQTSRGTDPE